MAERNAGAGYGGIGIIWKQREADILKVAGVKQAVILKRGTGPRRANKIAAAETAGKGYRADLRQVS